MKSAAKNPHDVRVGDRVQPMKDMPDINRWLVKTDADGFRYVLTHEHTREYIDHPQCSRCLSFWTPPDLVDGVCPECVEALVEEEERESIEADEEGMRANERAERGGR